METYCSNLSTDLVDTAWGLYQPTTLLIIYLKKATRHHGLL